MVCSVFLYFGIKRQLSEDYAGINVDADQSCLASEGGRTALVGFEILTITTPPFKIVEPRNNHHTVFRFYVDGGEHSQIDGHGSFEKVRKSPLYPVVLIGSIHPCRKKIAVQINKGSGKRSTWLWACISNP